jgi:hypothetical protein
LIPWLRALLGGEHQHPGFAQWIEMIFLALRDNHTGP